ncbi:MAG: M20 family metallopeptidase [Romboutsia sp.]
MDKEILIRECNNIKQWLVDVRRDIHKTPELSEKEYKTKEKIIKYLKEIKIDYIDFKNHNGVMAYIINKNAKTTIAIRADIDALPIKEETDSIYKSLNEGIMHACGHDAHIAILLGTCKILYSMKDKLNINVKFLFQPAEETVGGARFLVEDNCLEDPKVDYIFGLHVMPNLDIGYIESKYNTLNASTDEINICIKGKKCHGAYPENGIDALVASSHIIVALQSIISRNVSPLNSAVLTIGKIKGGDAQNIVCEEINMNGTLRTLNEETRSFMIKRIKNIVEDISLAFDCEGYLNLGKYHYPAVINDKYLVDIIKKNTENLLGNGNFLMKEKPSLGGEDFSFYTQKCRGAFFNLGCRNQEKNIIEQLHTSKFDIDEDCLPIGVMLHIANTLEFN